MDLLMDEAAVAALAAGSAAASDTIAAAGVEAAAIADHAFPTPESGSGAGPQLVAGAAEWAARSAEITQALWVLAEAMDQVRQLLSAGEGEVADWWAAAGGG